MVKINGAKNSEASGNKGSEYLKKPYPPNFNKTPAKIIEPAVGASTCASGSHVWNGHMGILIANDAKKERNNQICSMNGISLFINNIRLLVPE